MADLLSLTQRQTCEKLAEAMSWNNLKVSGLQAFLTSLIADDYDDIDVQDLITFGVLEENRGFSATSWTSDAVLNHHFLQSTAMKFFARNISYVNTNDFTTIMDAINEPTITEALGEPIMEKVRTEGYPDIVSYLKSIFNFGTTGQSAELCMQIGPEIIKFCDISIDGNTVSIVKNEQADFTYTFQQLGIVVAGTKMVMDLCQSLADGLHSPADLLAVLNHYTKSSSSAIATFAQNILRKGRDSISNAIFEIVSLFRSTFGNYSEDENGNITWDIQTHPVSSNFWLVAKNILIGGGQMLGTMLLFAGSIALKVVGGLIMVGASIWQAITTYTGTITGTTPLICDDAIDACYHDPIAQQDDQDISSFLFCQDLLDQLILYNRAKVIFPSGVLYLYNYKPDEHTICWKLFANMTSTCPALGLTYSYSGATIPGSPDNSETGTGHGAYFHWHTGFFSWAISNSIVDHEWCFSISDNNGKSLAIDPDTQEPVSVSKQNVLAYKQFVKSSLQLAAQKQGINLSGNSPDSGAWKVLWHVLKENVIQTLCYVFCNPEYYADMLSPTTINSSNSLTYSSIIDKIVAYDSYFGAPGYDDLVNAVISLGKVDHSSDKFFYSLLMSLGMLMNTPTVVSSINDSYLTDDPDSANYHYTIRIARKSNVSFESIPYYTDYIGLFPFLSIDPYAYVTPPTSDFKSIIFGALFASVIIAAVVVTAVVWRNTISKKLGFRMQAWGKKLLEDGETFRNGFSPEELSQLTPSDRAIYYGAFKSYKLKVTLYNLTAGILGLSSLDWINNWWNPYSNEATEIRTPVTTEMNPDSIEATADVIDSVGSLYRYTQDPEYYNEHETDAIVLYRLIAGRNPNSN